MKHERGFTMKGELRMNNTTNNTTVTTTRKELNRITNNAGDVVENLECAHLVLSDALEVLAPVNGFFEIQAHRYATIAIDYINKVLQDAQEVYKELDKF